MICRSRGHASANYGHGVVAGLHPCGMSLDIGLSIDLSDVLPAQAPTASRRAAHIRLAKTLLIASPLSAELDTFGAEY